MEEPSITQVYFADHMHWGGGFVTLHKRFAPLNEAAEAVSGASRPEEFAMTEGSDTESCELQERPSRRL